MSNREKLDLYGRAVQTPSDNNEPGTWGAFLHVGPCLLLGTYAVLEKSFRNPAAALAYAKAYRDADYDVPLNMNLAHPEASSEDIMKDFVAKLEERAQELRMLEEFCIELERFDFEHPTEETISGPIQEQDMVCHANQLVSEFYEMEEKERQMWAAAYIANNF